MTLMEKRINNVIRAMKEAKNYDMKHIWSQKLQELFKIRKARAYERLQDSARSVH